MSSIKVYILNLLYLFRMLKDKTKQSFLNWYVGKNTTVERIFDKNESAMNHLYKLSYNMTPIIDNIYLGNACDASYYYRLKKNNIKHIINVTEEIPNYFKNDFNYYTIKINDINQESFTNDIFRDTLQFIYKIQEKNKQIELNTGKHTPENILIHCYMGSSRSATIVILYLIDKYKMTLEKAIHFIKQKRDIININTQFLENLQDFQKKFE